MIRLAFCGGVYSNPFALRSMVRDAAARGCERIFCLGDLGGFGADPNGVWPLLTEHNIECIAGNYDIAIGSGAEDCGCGYTDPRDNAYAQAMYDFTRANTAPEFARWMARLPREHREVVDGVDVHLVHGSPLAVNDFFWESLPDDAVAQRVEASGADLLVCSHTGLPWQRRIGKTLVLNVGTIGKSANDGRRNGWYGFVEIDDGAVSAELVPVEFDWRSHAAQMREAGLPEPFAESVESGWWTTCLEVLPPRERSRGRYHCYHDALPEGFATSTTGWGALEDEDPTRPVVSLFDSASFPARLWMYTNYHCNLACSYCVVASSPQADPRRLGPARFAERIDEAVAEGFREVYVTGGEPFLEPDIANMLVYAAERLPTTVLTNAMLFSGRRGEDLARLADLPSLVIQTSVDSAEPGAHDAARGEGSWRRAMEGIEQALGLGLRVSVASTCATNGDGGMERLTERLVAMGIREEDHAIRPLVARGMSDLGVEVGSENLVPELTVSADGVWWHPVGADSVHSPDMRVAGARTPLGEAKRMTIERFLELRRADGTIAAPYACAIPAGDGR